MANRYWVGGTGNWDSSATTHWSTSSGGSGGASAPVSTDNVLIDSNSGGGIVAIISGAQCNNLTLTGWTGNFGGTYLNVYGSMVLPSNASTYLECYLLASSPATITSNGSSLGIVSVNSSSSITLDDNLAAYTLTFIAGTFNANGFNVNSGFVVVEGSATVQMGSGIWTLNGSSGFAWEVLGTPTITPSTSTIISAGASAIFSGGGKTYYNFEIKGPSTTIDGSNTFNTLTIDAGATITFAAASTQNITSLVANGSTGSPISLKSSSPGSQYSLALGSSGTASVQYINVQDCVASGTHTPVNATNFGIDNGNNSGWQFSAYSTSGILKSYVYQVFTQAGSHIGDLPNVVSDFAYTQNINTVGSQTTVICAISADTSGLPVSYLTSEDGKILTAEDGTFLTTERVPDEVGNDNDQILFRNGNKVKIYEYSSYNPNGKQVFSGEINNYQAHFGGDNPNDTIEIIVYSDGQDLDNFILNGSPYSVDQSQTSQDASLTIQNNLSGSVYDMGQTFTIGGGVTNLAAISIMLNTGGRTPNISINVYSSVPSYPGDGTVPLATVTQAVNNNTPTVVRFAIATPITVSPGQVLFFSVSTDFGDPSYPLLYYQDSDVYASGTLYYTAYPPVGWNAWPNPPGRDLYFVTYSNAGATTAVFTSEDPSLMLKSIIDTYSAAGGSLDYTAGSIDLTGLSLSYTFITSTVLDSIKTILTLAPDGFYYYADLGTDILFFKQSNQTADITLVKGKHINDLVLIASIENIKNILYFSGGLVGANNLYSVYQDNDSIAAYGPRLATQSDNRVTDQATADAIGESFIEENKDEQYQTTVDILDSTMDLTLLKPGQIIGFAGFGTLVDNLLAQVVQIDYSPEIATLTLGILPKRIILDFEKLRKGLVAEQTINNPTTPT